MADPESNPPTARRTSVLIVDRSADNREVLRTILRRHGCETIEAGRDDDALRLAREHHPDVFVLDADTVDLADANVCSEYEGQVRAENARVLLLGRARSLATPLPTCDVVAKPYHYAPLIRKIEDLLIEVEAAAKESDGASAASGFPRAA